MQTAEWQNRVERLLARRSVGWIVRKLGGPPKVRGSELEVGDAYRVWAPVYARENVACFIDDELARAMLDGLQWKRLLDAGCGLGERIAEIPGAVGIDASAEMLAAGGAPNVVAGDIREMPFAAGQFDMVWCRLVLGHLRDPLAAYREFWRVTMPGGYVYVSDFHPDAVRAGHRVSFVDGDGVSHAIEHYVHRNHRELARQAGLSLVARRYGAVGPAVRGFYVRGLGRRAYIRDFGLNIVSAYLFRRAEENRQ